MRLLRLCFFGLHLWPAQHKEIAALVHHICALKSNRRCQRWRRCWLAAGTRRLCTRGGGRLLKVRQGACMGQALTLCINGGGAKQ